MNLKYITVPKYIMLDRNGRAMAAALDRAMEIFRRVIRTGIALINDASTMPEWRLDEIAWEYALPWYDYGADLEQKRRIIADMLITLKLMGTPQGVKNVIAQYLGESAELRESGGAYHFRAVSHGAPLAAADREQLYRAIRIAKNVRSHMDEMTWEWDGDGVIYIGAAAQIALRAEGRTAEE